MKDRSFSRVASLYVLLWFSAEFPQSFSQPTHPKALFDSSDVAELIVRKDGAHGVIWQAMLVEATSYGPPSEFFSSDGASYGERLLTLAMVSLIDSTVLSGNGNTTVINLFLEYFDAMRSYEEWNEPVPFQSDLTISAYLMSLALAYDWHYNRLGDERREATADLLVEKALYWEATSPWLPDDEHLDEFGNVLWEWGGFFVGNHAFRNCAGLATVAFVLSEERETRELIDRMEEIRDIINRDLPVDGSDAEGASYHSTSKRHFMIWMEIRDRYLGTNSLDDVSWMNESIMFDLYSFLPGGTDNFGGVVQYGDATNRPNVPFFGIAGRLGSSGLANAPLAQWIANEIDDEVYDWLAYLWCDPAIPSGTLDQVPFWHHFRERGEFVWRSSWENTACYFTIKSGSSLGGHDQPDNGTIALFKAGVPYLTDYGLSRCFRTDEHNVILVNGLGQYGEMEGSDHGGQPVHPDFWGGLPFVLADNEYFDLLADPTPMYRDTSLTSWQREVIGFRPGLFIVRDEIEATQPIAVDHLFHSYRTKEWDGAMEPDMQYLPSFPYDANPWTSTTAGEFVVDPRDGAEKLFFSDLSPDPWTQFIETSRYIPKRLPDGSPNVIQGCRPGAFVTLGGRLRQSMFAQKMTSLSVIRFGDFTAESISGANGNGVHVKRGDDGIDVALVVWPNTDGSALVGPFRIEGIMGGRGASALEYFGRNVKILKETSGTSYIVSNQPVSVYARLQSETQDSALILLQTVATSTTVRLYCPSQPTQVLLNGIPFNGSYRWADGWLGFNGLSAGEYRFTCLFLSPEEARVGTLPTGTFIATNYPNPFNPSTTFRYGVGEPAQVTLKIYNMLGQLVRTVVDEHQSEGSHEVLWDGRNDVGVAVVSGMYLYRMRVGSMVETGKLMLLK